MKNQLSCMKNPQQKLMRNKERPSGYVQQCIAHTNPIQSLPPPPIIERKEAETLMSHCLKEFIRERLYGNMINYSRQTYTKHELCLSSLLPKIKTTKAYKYDSALNIRELVSKGKSSVERYNSIKKNSQKKKQKQIIIKRRSNSSLDSYNLHKNRRKDDFIIQLQNKSALKKNQKKWNVEKQIQNATSFISAIEDQSITMAQKEQIKRLKNENKIQEYSRREESKEKDKKIKSVESINIKKRYWQQFCLISEKNNLNTSKSGKQQLKLFNSKSNFSKECYMNYIQNTLQFGCLPIIQTLNFFQISNKVKDNMTEDDYKKVITSMANSSERVWAFLGFRFWDRDKNGLISYNDIFQTFKKIDSIKQKILKKNLNQKEKATPIIQEITEMVERLNLRLSELQQNEKNVETSVKDEQKAESKREQIYLEESFLNNGQIKYSDLEQILGEKMKEERQNCKSSVIESTKDLSMKFTSCYRYSFMATDHNEVTRENRENIEKLKESIKKKYECEDNIQQTTKGKKATITYSEFFKRKYFVTLRKNILKAFGVQKIQLKT